MELASSSSILSPKLPQNPTPYFSGRLAELHPRRKPITVRTAAKKDRHGRDSRLVDENMIVLRMRIDKIRAAERMDPRADPPFDWMEWEKEYYADGYGSNVCKASGLVQFALMSMRPTMAVGLVAMLVLSVPTSITLVGFHLVDALKSVLN